MAAKGMGEWNCDECGDVFCSWLEKNNHELTHHPISCWFECMADDNQTDMEYSFNMNLLNEQDCPEAGYCAKALTCGWN